MGKIKPGAGWRPTHQQELLLRAALSEREEALHAWQQWRGRSDFTCIDRGSARLLPLVYHNLHIYGVTGPDAEVLREAYIRAWCDNEILFLEAARLLRSFQLRGIGAIVLKGVALASLFYRDTGLRPMSDIDILVRPESAGAAIRLLSETGWRSAYRAPEALIPYHQAVEFLGGRGCTVDLHWRILWDGRQDVGDDEFWDAAVDFEINQVTTRALNATDQLLHVCVHGAAWNDMPTVRWVADAASILRVAQSEINWDRLLDHAERRRLLLPMADTLEYLQGMWPSLVPPDVIETVKSLPSSRREHALYRIRTGPGRTLNKVPVFYYWLGVWRSSNAPLHRKLLDYLKYLQCLWGAEHLWQVPFLMAWRAGLACTQIFSALLLKEKVSPSDERHTAPLQEEQ